MWGSVIAVVLLVILAVKVRSVVKKVQAKNRLKEGEGETEKRPVDADFKFRWPINYIYTCLLFPLVTFNLVFLLLTADLDLNRVSPAPALTFGNSINSLILLLGVMVSACVVGIEGSGLGQKGGQERIGGVHQMKQSYIAIFLARVIVFSMLLVVYLHLSSQYFVWSILTLFLAYSIFLLAYRPYTGVLSNISLLVN